MSSLKKTCGTFALIFLGCALLTGFLAARRILITAVPAGLIGGGILWLGIAYLIGIADKTRKARIIRRAINGEAPRDGATIAATGRISPIGETLTSPFTQVSCVMYTYEVRPVTNQSMRSHYGNALVPCVIQGQQRSMKLLALPTLDVPQRRYTSERERRNAAEFIEKTKFAPPSAFDSDETRAAHVRNDHTGLNPATFNLQRATLLEKIVQPGEEVCVLGLYSASEGGLTHEPNTLVPSLTLMNGDADVIQRRLVRRSIGNAIGGIIFIAITVAALIAFYANVPLEAAEQMNPNRATWWWEVKLERLIDKELKRPPHNQRSESTPTNFSSGEAHGRIEGNGRDVIPTNASATRDDNSSTVTLRDTK